LIRVMVEGRDEAQTRDCAERIARAVSAFVT
jgi:phosphomannomutase